MATKKVYLAGGTTFLALIATLLIISNAKIEASGDITCAGTIEDPCLAFVNITTNITTYIYNKEGFRVEFDKALKDSRVCLYNSSSFYNKESFEYPKTICGKRYQEINDFNNFKFTKGKKYRFKIIGFKNNPRDIIKWSFYGAGTGIDPTWLGSSSNYTAWYQFNGTYIDDGGRGNNLSNTGGTFNTTIYKTFNSSWQGDGSSYAQKIAPAGMILGNTDWTMALWARTTTIPASGQKRRIAHFGYTPLATNGGGLVFEYKNISGTTVLSLTMDNNVPCVNCAATNMMDATYTLVSEQWYHFILEWNSTSKNTTLYVNNTFVKESNFSATVNICGGVSDSECQITLADHPLDSGSQWVGQLDDLRLLTFMLNSSQRSNLYNSSNANILGNLDLDPTIAQATYVNVSLDGNNYDTRYELQRTVNLTFRTDSGSNVTIYNPEGEIAGTFNTSTSPYNISYTVDNLTINKWNNSFKTFNFTSESIAWIDIDNRTDITNFSLRFNAGNSAGNVSLDWDNDGTKEILLWGNLTQSVLQVEDFIDTGNFYRNKNFSFASAGSKIFHFNISTAQLTRWFETNTSNLKDVFNLTFLLGGIESNAGAEFTKTETFQNTTAINLTSTATNNISNQGCWDCFESNTTFDDYQRTSCSTAGTCTLEILNGKLVMTVSGEAYPNHATSFTSVPKISVNDFKNYRNITIDAVRMQNVPASSSGCRHTWKLYFTDGTNRFELQNWLTGDVGDARQHAWRDWVFIQRTSENNYDITSMQCDGGLGSSDATCTPTSPSTTSKTVTGLSTAINWTLEFFNYVDEPQYACSGGSNVTWRLNSLNVSSAKMELVNSADGSLNGTRYINGIITSNRTYSTSNNANSVIVNPVHYMPANTSITYYVSADDGASWTEAIPGADTVLGTAGTNFRWRANMTIDAGSTAVNRTPEIKSLTLQVISALPTNISIDVGNDETPELINSSILNASIQRLAFENLSIASIRNYTFTNCNNTLICKIPIKMTSATAGKVEISKFNFTMDTKSILLNMSKLEPLRNRINFNFSTNGGTVEARNLSIGYKGSANLTWNATSDNAVSTLRTILARYSKFNYSLPINILDIDFFPPTANSKNITPFGQNNTMPILNISNQAYEEPINIYFSVNETYNSCLKIFAGNTSSEIGAPYVNASNSSINPTKIWNNVSLSSSAGVWLFLNLSSCSGGVLFPYFQLDTQCFNCTERW